MTTAYFTAEAKSLCAELTPRQREVLVFMCKGATRDDSARMLGIGRATLNSHMKAVLRLLDVGTTIEAAVIATKAGLV